MTRTFMLSSLAELTNLAATLPKADVQAAQAATDRQNSLTKPPGALGHLEDLAIFMAGWQGVEKPEINTAQALVFAGNHGICDRGVNPFPQEVTAQMVLNFEHGGAAINQLCRANGADLSVVAMDLETPTKDFTIEPAMSEAEVLKAMNVGAGAVNPDADILLLGEMGIGNSTIAAALAATVAGGTPEEWVGRGTGSDDAGVRLKASVIREGQDLHASLLTQTAGALMAFGGREQAAICGATLAARSYGIPVMLDGFICTAAAGVLHGLDPTLLDHCLVGHASAEPGHPKLLEAIGKRPVLQFDMRLGEGSGAALALGVLRSALECHNGMATFAEAGVSDG